MSGCPNGRLCRHSMPHPFGFRNKSSDFDVNPITTRYACFHRSDDVLTQQGKSLRKTRSRRDTWSEIVVPPLIEISLTGGSLSRIPAFSLCVGRLGAIVD